MFGNNPIRGAEKGDGTTLQVQEIFATLQGEGLYTGWPALFIRLGGCNLACSFCDTEFESFRAMALESVLAEVKNKCGRATLAVITGGEPLRQPIAPLCEALLQHGMKVQIETNGTLIRPLPEAVELICSPKNPTGKGYGVVRPDVLARTSALKFIVSAHNPDYHDVPEMEYGDVPIYVQPMDEQDEAKNAQNRSYAAALAMAKGYRLSVQVHKWIGVP